MSRSERATRVVAALTGASTEQTRGKRRIVLDAPVDPYTNEQGEVVGVHAWVRLFEDGHEVPIDPHRIIINPPTRVVVDGRVGIDAERGVFMQRKTRDDPQAAFWDALWDSVTGTPNPRGWRTRGTVTTVYSALDDGYLESYAAGFQGGYTAARAGGASFNASTSATSVDVGQRLQTAKDTTYRCLETFLSFDTSSIDDSDDVSDVSLGLWLTGDNSTTDFTIEARERDWGVSLTSGDWVAGASLSGLTLLASLSTSGIGSTGSYKTFTSETAFTSATNLKTGVAYLVLSSSRLRAGNQPSGDEYVSFSSADTSGTTQDPKLTITHASANTAPTANAGSDQTVDEGDTVNLDGSASSDPEGSVTYSWTVLDADGTGLTTGDLTGATTATPSFVAPEVDADATIVLQLQVTDSGSLTDTDTVSITVEDATLITVTGAGGLLVGGAATVSSTQPVFVMAAGGVEAGGSATVAFVHGGQVASDIVVEWDFDNDGDFDEPEEDITAYVLSAETFTGRDWPSLLTGRAGPGSFRATLRNDDDRFSYFNTSSPLVTSPFSLKTGRKLRVRTTDAGNPDQAVLARDRFQRANGSLGADEEGNTWSGPLADDFALISERAVASSEGETHIGIVDASSTDYYAQVTITEAGLRGNVVGLVYRYQDSDDYSLFVLDVAAAELQLVDVVSGTPSEVASESVEAYDRMTLGVLVSGTTVTAYMEGVPVLSGTAIQTDETEVGIYAEWGINDNRPAFDNFHVWAGLPVDVEGVLWTGDISDLVASVAAGPEKLATISGQGWLSRLAGQKVDPPSTATGRRTGMLVGNTLATANMLHPPGRIDEGDVTTGPFGMEEADAVEVARRFEETELGFLYESQEGPLVYEGRTARAGASIAATFTDAPGGQFGYHALTPFDWRREVVNRVFAGVAPEAPSGVSSTAYVESSSDGLNVTMPATVAAGDLLLVFAVGVGASRVTNYLKWQLPPGWSELSGGSQITAPQDGETMPLSSADDTRIFARVADGSEGSVTYKFATGGFGGMADGGGAANIYQVTNWFGTLEGVTVAAPAAGSAPGVIFPPWRLTPSLFIAVRFGVAGSWGGILDTVYPLGYAGGISAQDSGAGGGVAVQSAHRVAVSAVENPGAFEGGYSGTFDYDYVGTVMVAVRGPNGDPPIADGFITIQADDTASQNDHNSIRTHRNASNLFASVTDAQAYADLVLATYADDRPIVSIALYSTKSAAYRAQAIRRRVGDKIELIADHNSGFGISAEFYIESIGHRWSHGTRLWETTWELSPA